MAKRNENTIVERSESAKNGNLQCKREAKTGKFVTVKKATDTSKGVVKRIASKQSAALTRLANR